MAYTLYTGEMLHALQQVNPLKAGIYTQMYINLNELIAIDLGGDTEADVTPDTVIDDGRLAATFAPTFEGQPIPEALKGWDNEDEWSDS